MVLTHLTDINREHLAVESKDLNEGRKACKKAGPIIETVLEGKRFRLPPLVECRCLPPCIFMIEERVAVPAE